MRMQKGKGVGSEMREAYSRKNTGKLDGNLISARKFGLWEEKTDVWGEIRFPHLWGPWNYYIIRNTFFRKFSSEEKTRIKTGPSQQHVCDPLLPPFLFNTVCHLEVAYILCMYVLRWSHHESSHFRGHFSICVYICIRGVCIAFSVFV